MPKMLVEKNTNLPNEENDDNDEVDVDVEVEVDDKTPQNNTFGKTKKIVRKAGRTLLIKLINDTTTFDDSLTENLTGLLNKTNLSNNKTLFLTFDTKDNSLNALKVLRSKSINKFHVKFSYYKLFFTINGLTDKSDYNDSKKELIEFISKDDNVQVLYCKFYY